MVLPDSAPGLPIEVRPFAYVWRRGDMSLVRALLTSIPQVYYVGEDKGV